jgi:hypothetical protein
MTSFRKLIAAGRLIIEANQSKAYAINTAYTRGAKGVNLPAE